MSSAPAETPGGSRFAVRHLMVETVPAVSDCTFRIASGLKATRHEIQLMTVSCRVTTAAHHHPLSWPALLLHLSFERQW